MFYESGLVEINYQKVSVFSPNAGKYGPEKTPYLDTFHAVSINKNQLKNLKGKMIFPQILVVMTHQTVI